MMKKLTKRWSPFRSRTALAVCLIAPAVLLTGCFGFLKPAPSGSRYFVLTPLPVADQRASNPAAPVVGLGRVKLPSYLLDSSLAIRNGPNEVNYLGEVLWAERLDSGFQRALAANLATLLPTDQIRLNAWNSDEVRGELLVTVEQFDLDTRGNGVLVAWWRIMSPGGEKTIKAGEARFTRTGPAPDTDPSGAVATLSNLLADLSRQLAQAIQESLK